MRFLTALYITREKIIKWPEERKIVSRGYARISVQAAFLIFIFLLFASIVHSANFNVLVDVNVTQLSEITVSQSSINWTQVIPGQAGGLRTLDIRNTGSLNATDVFAFVSTLMSETASPYGSSDASNYSAGDVLVVRNATDQNFYWAGKLEWNWTSPISNIDLSNLDANSRASQGYFRNASNAYIWALGNGTKGTCNTTGAQFAITDVVDDGTAATRKPDPTMITFDGGDIEYGYYSINRSSSFLNGTCVAVSSNCNKLYFYKYDARPGLNRCSNVNYLVNKMVPGDTVTITADTWVPLGMPAGNMTEDIWSFVSS